jgi:hypothetical protein
MITDSDAGQGHLISEYADAKKIDSLCNRDLVCELMVSYP